MKSMVYMAMKNFLVFCWGILLCLQASAQTKVSGIVLDAETHRPLPFATLQQGNSKQGFIADINGQFSFNMLSGVYTIKVSYTGYKGITINVQQADTIYLEPVYNLKEEVVVRPPYEKIKRIINTAIRNKPQNNPDKYDAYRYDIYYKMHADVLPNDEALKARYAKQNKLQKYNDTISKRLDTALKQNHILFSETYSRVHFERPGKRQEIVLASRFSGFKKTFFTNVVTGVLPFHAYGDFIKLNTVDYINPLANGWQSRYQFDLMDEVLDGTDTIFILRYKAKKGISFKSLQGNLYIHSNGYAISHITAQTPDTGDGRVLKMQQVYRFVKGKWFPRELNYSFIFTKYPSPEMGMTLSGHSTIDSVFYDAGDVKFDKAQAVKLHDSVDQRTDNEWQRYRFEPVTLKEQKTYVLVDSIMQETGIGKYLENATNLAIGRIPVYFMDVDLTRLLAFNTYEGTRLGLGAYTNDKISKYFSVGGWFGYGFRDRVWKYGASARIFPNGKKEHWVELAYQNNYRNTGNINIHPEIDRRGLQNWLLVQVDKIEEYRATLHGRFGYWEMELSGKQQNLQPQYFYNFNEAGSQRGNFDVTEVSLNLRYAFREKRTPVYGYYLPAGTKFPIVYLQLTGGQLSSGSYLTNYTRVLAAVDYKVHINRWGTDNIRLMGGMIQAENGNALPRSLLLAGNGYRFNNEYQIYAWGGFMTMLPFTYFSDAFGSVLYRHDFDRYFYNHKYSKPSLSVAHNLLYGSLSARSALADGNISTPSNGYHESGLIINNLIRLNYLNIAHFNINIGGFYHWANAPFDWGRHGRWVIGSSISF
ncbi:hypothetical protein CAP35_00430 [Chitinophagaceae bacterium IBVUCB1]|nr:hypothetical protein CAP35_00430 [Chitinophagaceae bacterium IBVUCB1]